MNVINESVDPTNLPEIFEYNEYYKNVKLIGPV